MSERTLYHGTNADFDAFSLEFCAREDMADNGFLGVWLARDLSLAQSFGQVVMHVQVPPCKTYVMPISDLSKLNHQIGRAQRDMDDEAAREYAQNAYGRLRQDLLTQGYGLIAIREIDDSDQIFIALDPEQLQITHKARSPSPIRPRG